MRASSSGGAPAWRVPNRSPAPRWARSASASANPSSFAATSAEPRARLVGQRAVGRAQEADPRPAAPPHPPAQLVQLRDAEALRLLDDHHRRVRRRRCPARRRWSRPARRSAPAANAPQRLLLRVRRPARRAAGRRAPARSSRTQPRVLRDRGDGVGPAGRLAHRTDDERLPPLGDRLAQAPVGGARARPAPTQHDGRRRRRARAGARSGTRRRDRRAAPAPGCAGSASPTSTAGAARRRRRARAPARARTRDAEAVLLVDDRQRQARQPRRRVQQRLRPDEQRDAPRGRRARAAPRAPRPVVRAGQRRDPQAQARRRPAAARAPAARPAPRSAPSSASARPPPRPAPPPPSATAVLPLPTSPTSSRCIGAGAAQVGGDLVERAPLRRRQREPERRLQPLAHAGRRGAAAPTAPPRPPRRAAAGTRPA